MPQDDPNKRDKVYKKNVGTIDLACWDVDPKDVFAQLIGQEALVDEHTNQLVLPRASGSGTGSPQADHPTGHQ